jgi:hypothetical protein
VTGKALSSSDAGNDPSSLKRCFWQVRFITRGQSMVEGILITVGVSLFFGVLQTCFVVVDGVLVRVPTLGICGT